MLETFRATLTPMLVMLCCIIIGYIAKVKSFTPDNTAAVLSKLENYFFVPALIINTFMQYCTVASIREEYQLVLYATVVLAVAVAVAVPLSGLLVKKDHYQRNIYKYALTFGNFSFLGNAIVPAICGEEMLYDYMLFSLPLNIAVYTWGIFILIPQGEKKQNVFTCLRNPIFISIIIGEVLGLSGAVNLIPAFLTTTIRNCAACMGPLAMILTGFVIGGHPLPTLLNNYKIYIASFLRLFVLPAVFLILLYFIGADKRTLTCALFAYATPLGLNTVVFPAAYGGDTVIGASMAMVSHAICIISIPLMYAALCVLV